MSLNRRDLFALPLGTAMSLTGLAAAPTAVDETWIDERRNREVPVKVRWPAETASTLAGGLPVILFSHGLGGTREGGEVWGRAWAAAGFVVVHLQHPGSDLAAVRAVARNFSLPLFSSRSLQITAPRRVRA